MGEKHSTAARAADPERGGGARTPDVAETVRTLLRRQELVDRLVDGGVDRRELAADLAQSRPTVYRGLEELRELGLARESNGEYVPTTYGLLVHDAFVETCDRFEAILDARGPLTNLPQSEVELFRRLTGAELVERSRYSPHRPHDRIASVLEAATRVRGFVPALPRRLLGTVLDQCGEGDLEGELGVEAGGFRRLREEEPGPTERLVSASGFTVKTVDRQLPFGLLVVAEPAPAVCVLSYSADGTLVGVLRESSPDAVRRAERVYDRYETEMTAVHG